MNTDHQWRTWRRAEESVEWNGVEGADLKEENKQAPPRDM